MRHNLISCQPGINQNIIVHPLSVRYLVLSTPDSISCYVNTSPNPRRFSVNPRLYIMSTPDSILYILSFLLISVNIPIYQLARIAGRSCGEVLETIHFLMIVVIKQDFKFLQNPFMEILALHA